MTIIIPIRTLIVSIFCTISFITYASQEKLIKFLSNGNIVKGIDASEIDYIQIESVSDEIAEKTQLIFSGENESDYAVDLTKYNRITFGNESMTLTSSSDSEKPIDVLYSAHNRIKIGNTDPTVTITNIEAVNPIQLRYIPSAQILTLITDCIPKTFNIEVFNINGTLILHGELQPGESLSVATLSSGTYVAIVVGNECNHLIKFIK